MARVYYRLKTSAVGGSGSAYVLCRNKDTSFPVTWRGLQIIGGLLMVVWAYKLRLGREDGTSEKVYLHPLSHCGKRLQCHGSGLTNRLRNGFLSLEINSNMRR